MEGTAEQREDAHRAGVDLKTLVAAAHAALEAHAAKIDALNVYPVPDGDTGTNMLLTLRSVLEEVSRSPGLEGKEAARVVSRAALMGARGNSGVILSQILRGACEVLGRARSWDAETIAVALSGAEERAYAAVQSPVEGTMLSVIKDAAAAARSCLERGERDRVEVLRAVTLEAHASVMRTPELLSVLEEAEVVDAGGLGLAVILDGLWTALSGEDPSLDLDEAEAAADGERLREAVAHSAEERWGYCTEFVVSGFSGEAEDFEARIQDIGKSVLVVPDEDLVKVHLHTHDPGSALTYAGRFGRLSEVKVEDMETQTRAWAESADPSAPGRTAKLGVVAASRGEGSRELFESMGAVVIEGGQGANPSAADFARAVGATGAQHVVLLPNNRNILPTVEQVGGLVEAETHVVPTTSIAGGLAVMVGYDAEGEPAEVVGEMREICTALHCAEVTRAAREARIGGREVPEGAYIGLLNGELVAVENGVEDAAIKLAQKMLEKGADIVTLLQGYEMDEGTVAEIRERIRCLDEGVEVEIKDGGQPLYPLQMVAE